MLSKCQQQNVTVDVKPTTIRVQLLTDDSQGEADFLQMYDNTEENHHAEHTSMFSDDIKSENVYKHNIAANSLSDDRQ